MSITSKKRLKIYLKNNFKCVYCGNSPAFDPNVELTIDHIIPKIKGGNDDDDNLCTACRTCNCIKSNRTIKEMKIKIEKRKLNIRRIFYPKQTRTDRIERLEKLLCPIHARRLNSISHILFDEYQEEIYICSIKNCGFKIKMTDQCWYEIFPEFEYIMEGLFCPI